MSAFSEIFSWALHAAGNAAQKAAIEQVQKAALAFNQQIETHAPDVAEMAKSEIKKASTAAIAGLMTRKF